MNVIGIVASDLHLSLRPPVARSAEDDWLKAQARPLDELRQLAADSGNPPIIYAGDLFDRHNPPVELVNWAIANLPPGHAVPGQHDLRCHRYADLEATAYWTLAKAGVVADLRWGKPVGAGQLQLWGFPFGKRIVPCPRPHSLCIDVAVCHAYVWTAKTGYAGAPGEQRLRSYLPKLAGYDVACYGDNHKEFLIRNGKQTIINTGAFIRRKADEQGYQPCVGLIGEDGGVRRHRLDCSKDKFLDADEIARAVGGEGFEGFVEELAGLADAALDFGAALRRALEQGRVSGGVKKLVLQALEVER